MAEEVERKIYFYRMHVRPDRDGRTPEFNVNAACEAIDGLQFLRNDTTPASRYMLRGDDEYLCVWPGRNSAPDSIRLALGAIRRRDLPQLEQDGDVTPLEIEESGLVEQTHAVFFPEGIVGSEFNFYGPRITALSHYFGEKLPGYPQVRFRAILSRDAAARLQELDDIRLVRLRLHRSQFELLRAAGESLTDALESTAEQYGADSIEIVLRPGGRGRDDTLSDRLFGVVRTLIGLQGREQQPEALKIQGRTAQGRSRLIDVLNDRFIYVRHVAVKRDTHRCVSPISMYGAIEAAYNEHRDELITAVGIGDEED